MRGSFVMDEKSIHFQLGQINGNVTRILDRLEKIDQRYENIDKRLRDIEVGRAKERGVVLGIGAFAGTLSSYAMKLLN